MGLDISKVDLIISKDHLQKKTLRLLLVRVLIKGHDLLLPTGSVVKVELIIIVRLEDQHGVDNLSHLHQTESTTRIIEVAPNKLLPVLGLNV